MALLLTSNLDRFNSARLRDLKRGILALAVLYRSKASSDELFQNLSRTPTGRRFDGLNDLIRALRERPCHTSAISCQPIESRQSRTMRGSPLGSRRTWAGSWDRS